MKKTIIYLTVLVFMFVGISFAGQRSNRDQKQYQQKQQRHNTYQKPYRKRPRHKVYQKRRHNPQSYGHGYRNHYYGKKRHYQPRHYRGHWRSWDSWHNYYRNHRHEYRNGRYYKDNRGHLYFLFESREGTFGFSIGR